MAYFEKFKLTKRGKDLLNNAVANKKVIIFTKIKLGEGKPLIDSEIDNLIELKSPFKEIPVLQTDVLATDKALKIKGYFDNKGFLTDKNWSEIGVFAQIKDEPNTEILYSYSKTNTQDELIPAESKGSFKRTLNILNYIGSTSSVTFNITEIKDRYAFNSIEELKLATFLKKGDKVELWGQTILGDYTTYNLIVDDVKKEGVELNNKLFANKVEDTDGSLKLNKGEVTVEYDDAGKIEAKIKEIITKFKNYCPISVGSIDVRYDNKNPAELYPSTTWELLTAGKYIQSGSTALQTGGSNSVNIGKEHLPNTKLKVDSFSLTTQPHTHQQTASAFDGDVVSKGNKSVHGGWGDGKHNLEDWTNSGGGQNTGSASPYTETLGSGTALTIQPEYITLRFWKRLT